MEINYLDFVRQNIWAPHSKIRIKHFDLPRLTVNAVAVHNVSIMGNRIKLPGAGPYHVYMIGLADQSVFRIANQLFDRVNDRWFDIKDITVHNHVDIKIYTEAGHIIPADMVHLSVTDRSALLVAISVPNDIYKKIAERDLYMRVYHNASNHYEDTSENIVSLGGMISEVVDYTNILNAIGSEGSIATIDGQYVESHTYDDVEGKYFSLTHDPLMLTEHRFYLSDLPTFRRYKDDSLQYAIRMTSNISTIADKEDMDIYVCSETNGGLVVGRYYSPVKSKVRYVGDTHIAVSTEETQRLLSDLLEDNDVLPGKGSIVIVRKNTASQMKKVVESNYLIELDSRTDEGSELLMSNTTGSPDLWFYGDLENSQYTKLKACYDCLDFDVLVDTLGYDGVINAGASNVMSLHNGQTTVTLPFGLSENVTVLEYDNSGKLLHWHPHNAGPEYVIKSDPGVAATIEILTGVPEEQYIDSGQKHDYQVYRYTDGVGYTIVDNNDYHIADELPVSHDMEQFTLRYNNVLPVEQHVFSSDHINANGLIIDYRQEGEIPLGLRCGYVKAFLNRKPLVEGVDYHVLDGRVGICKNIDTQNEDSHEIVLFFVGMEVSNDKTEEVIDVGFIYHGGVGSNGKYLTHRSTQFEIVIDGSVVTKEKVKFLMDDPTPDSEHVDNGKPYHVRRTMNGTRIPTNVNMLPLYQQALRLTSNVSNYMTEHYPITLPASPSVRRQDYPCISNFYQLAIRRLLDETGPLPNTDVAMNAYLADIDNIINVDILGTSAHIEDDVTIIPTRDQYPVTVTVEQMTAINLLVNIHSPSLVDIEKYFIIGA